RGPQRQRRAPRSSAHRTSGAQPRRPPSARSVRAAPAPRSPACAPRAVSSGGAPGPAGVVRAAAGRPGDELQCPAGREGLLRFAPSLLLVALLSSLVQASLARSLPTATTDPGIRPCLNQSQSLLQAVSNMLQKARETLVYYPCTPEEIDHEDITKDKTSTMEACLPLELASVWMIFLPKLVLKSRPGHQTSASSRDIESCLPSRNTSFMMALCLRSISEDLKMYQMEFQAVNEKLLMDPKRQIFLDQNLLKAITELMQALNLNSDPPELEQKPSLEDLDFYKTKTKLCILLHAFRIRAVTIDRMMSYLSA
ncbi:Interleukin-12 subunit alpha, partial [Galemys pyrenaicus]